MLRSFVVFLVACLCLADCFAQDQFDLYIESGIHHSARSVAFSPDGRFIAAGSLDRTIRIWESRGGREVLTLPKGRMTVSLLYTPDGKRLLGSGEDGTIEVWDLEATRLAATLRCAASAAPIALVNEGALLLCADEANGQLRRWDLATLTEAPPLALPGGSKLGLLRLVDNGVLLAATGTPGEVAVQDAGSVAPLVTLPVDLLSSIVAMSVGRRTGRVAVSDGTKVVIWRFGADAAPAPSVEHTFAAQTVHALRFSPSEDLLALATENGDIVLLDSATWTERRRIASRSNRIENAGMLPDSPLLALQVWYDRKFTFNLKTGAFAALATLDVSDPFQWSTRGAVGSQEFVVENRGDSILLRKKDGVELCTIVVLDKQNEWVVVTPDGRFDTNMDLARVEGVHWYARNRWAEPLPLEIFMRDYFEPRLLPRLLAQGSSALKPVRPQSELDRHQPLVHISSVKHEPATDVAEVVVEVSGQGGAVYDVRLFRNDQLVGQFPHRTGPVPEADAQLDTWRALTRVPQTDDGGRSTVTFRVALANRFTGQPVFFSAYAYNRDRVKSDTARHAEFIAPQLTLAPQPRAYVITMGVDSYDDPGLDLAFAAKDARILGDALSHVKGYEVVRLNLLSTKLGARRVAHATKANLRAILMSLAGRTEGGSIGRLQLGSINQRALRQLRRATPDDVVILAFSGHGYTRPGGQFYLLPSDSGQWADPATAPLDKVISSADLTEWLYNVDAGQFALIIDACHAAASVDDGRFKPGPMGDSGLGQLAYDKGMLVLAATQSNDVALEAGALGQGLLSYALARDALSRHPDRPDRVRGDLNGDGRLTLVEWLGYGEQRVPALYQDVRAGRIHALRGNIVLRDPTPDDEIWIEDRIGRVQTPAFFNFRRAQSEVELVVLPR